MIELRRLAAYRRELGTGQFTPCLTALLATPARTGHQGSGNQVCRPPRRGMLSRTAQRVVPGWPFPLGAPS